MHIFAGWHHKKPNIKEQVIKRKKIHCTYISIYLFNILANANVNVKIWPERKNKSFMLGIQLFKTAVPDLFCTRHWFHGGQFFRGPGVRTGEDGFRMIQVHYIQAHLLLCGPVPYRLGLVLVLSPEVGDPCFKLHYSLYLVTVENMYNFKNK